MGVNFFEGGGGFPSVWSGDFQVFGSELWIVGMDFQVFGLGLWIVGMVHPEHFVAEHQRCLP